MRCQSSTNFRRCISQFLCFSLLLQATGIAAALPLPPEKTFLTESELTADPAGTHSAPAPSERWSKAAQPQPKHSPPKAAGSHQVPVGEGLAVSVFFATTCARHRWRK